MTGILETIQSRREEVIRKLRDREPELMTELDILDSASRGAARGELVGPYSSYKRAIDAIIAYLEKNPESPAKSIATDIVSGGFGGGSKYAYASAMDSIRYHLRYGTNPLEEVESGSGEKLIRLRTRGGMAK